MARRNPAGHSTLWADSPDRGRLRAVRYKYSPELLAEAAAECTTVNGVVRFLDARQVGGTQAHIARQLKKFQIDTSHFLGQAHNRGKRRGPKRTADEVLVKRSSGAGRERGRALRRALTQIGVGARCAECGTGPSWRGKAMTLEIDHANGDLADNRRQNPRYLCPNCHATTETYCRKKRVGIINV